ncbi:MAG TPA: exodeoxyribonuclease V subunit beta [Verrucomicrobiota bacterium]|nr:exodeoxyribonuclease V subunit beta [Verrucomicrobiota bacterium]
MKPTQFDLASAALEPGVTLLEASAGTGKTYTIAGLVLRLLLERRLLISELLVVTFTEAATAELRTRIRNLLVEAREAVQSGAVRESWLRRYAEAPAEARAAWFQQLQAALESFDAAPLFTLHGFCRRVLWDRAFETGAWFDLELAPDLTALLREATDAFWRRQFAESTEFEALVARVAEVNADTLYALLRLTSRALEVRVLDRAKGRTRANLVRELSDVFTQAKTLWDTKREEITRPFGSRGGWGKKPYNRDAEMTEHWRQLDRFFDSRGATASAASSLLTLAASTMWENQSRKSTQPVPAHPFFNLCDRWKQLVADYASALQAEFLSSVQSEIRHLRERDKTMGFDDLLTQLRAALRARGGDALAERIRQQYRAVLIDEFQDTDSVQFEIFKRIFGRGGDPLYLVGDPKQAIYSFRGADVFAYLQAQKLADCSRTLGENFRSEAPLVAAVNAVFQPPGTLRPFGLEAIQFHPVEARGAAESAPLTEEGRRRPSLPIWFWEPPEEMSNKGRQQEAVADAVASEIVRLLSEPSHLGDRRLRPGDVAVLVDTHAQAALVANSLRERRVPAVLHTQESVWQSVEAHELERVLTAIAEPGWEAGLRGALTTTLLGVDAGELDTVGTDDQTLERWRNAFAEHARQWEAMGFLAMFEGFLRTHGVRARLLAQAEGERQLTNLGHLAELLHAVAEQRRLGPHGLRAWLGERRVSDEPVTDEALLRLERDDEAVQLVTIHRSKGLEYPVVFCPFLLRKWAARGDEMPIFHDPDAAWALTLDLGTADQPAHFEQMAGERFAENLRLTYVALTRAKHRCYVVWGTLRGSEDAALGWLLHPASNRNEWRLPEVPVGIREFVKQLPAAQRHADLEALAHRARSESASLAVPPIEISTMPSAPTREWTGEAQPALPLSVREFRGDIQHEWSVTSFTGLTRGHRDEAPELDDGRSLSPAMTESSPDLLAEFRGARAGVCLHELFETVDFAVGETPLRPAVTDILRAHGFSSEELAGPVTAMIRRTLNAPLPGGFALSAIARSERINELEFCLPLRRITPEALTRVWERHSLPGGATRQDFERLQFRPVEGFLRGFMDLVFRRDGRFWLVDWKSNWLGPTPDHYDRAHLAREMGREQYHWQYHLYLVALDAWLRQRVPGYRYDRDCGGVLYLFIRGVGADPARPELGIFHDRPSPDLLDDFRALLIPTPGETGRNLPNTTHE